jgi:hypothetical protein
VIERGDPYFNPNLAQLSLEPALRFPGETPVPHLVKDQLRRLHA